MSDLRLRQRPSRAVRRRRTIVIASIAGATALVLAGIGIAVALVGQNSGSVPTKTPTASPTQTPTRTPTPTPTPTPTFNKSAQSLTDPNSYWVVVNKMRPLNPQDYAPADLVTLPVPYVNGPLLRKAASDAVVAMFAAYTAETGLKLQSQSAYRSYSVQRDVYNGWVSSLGQTAADLTSARPGTSEHQTGLAIDVNSLPDQGCGAIACFNDSPQAKWLAANSWRFGFIVRYPAGKTAITGYEYESWHMRYVGIELATEMHTTGIQTLEEFFGLPAAPSYAN